MLLEFAAVMWFNCKLEKCSSTSLLKPAYLCTPVPFLDKCVVIKTCSLQIIGYSLILLGNISLVIILVQNRRSKLWTQDTLADQLHSVYDTPESHSVFLCSQCRPGPGEGYLWLCSQTTEAPAGPDSTLAPYPGWLSPEIRQQPTGLPARDAWASGGACRSPGCSRHWESKEEANSNAAKPLAHRQSAVVAAGVQERVQGHGNTTRWVYVCVVGVGSVLPRE